MRIRKNFTRMGIVLCFICAASSCNTSQDSSSDLITIDVEKAYDEPHREVNLSELVKDIEYIKLETNENCLVGSPEPCIISDNYILFFQYSPKRVLLFSRAGKFLHEIGKNGNGPGEHTHCFGLEISPDEKQVLINDGNKQLLAYNINGKFEKSIKLPSGRISGFSYNPNNQILIFKNRPYLPYPGGHQILIFDSNLMVIDSMLYSKFNQAPSRNYEYAGMITNNVELFYRNIDSDTIFQISESGEIYPELKISFGNYQAPKKYIPDDEKDAYFRHSPLFTSTPKNYLLTFFGNPKTKRGRFSFMIHNKKTQESFFLKKREIFTPDGIGKSQMPNNDLDGLSDPQLHWTTTMRSSKREVVCVNHLAIPDVQAYFDTKIIEPEKLSTQKYYNRVKKLLDESDIEDNPIIRICYLK